MKLFEHEGKELFERVGIGVSRGMVVSSKDELANLKLKLPVMVKAQVLSGKRGKRGLVERIEDERLIGESVEKLIGKEVDGEKVEKVLVEEAVEVERELYVAITYSTKSRGPVLLFSEKGGVEVEEIGEVEEIPLQATRDKIQVTNKFQITNDKLIGQLEILVNKLWRLFREKDLFLAEINPLALTKNGKLVALDAKVVTDDAAVFRQEWKLPPRNILGHEKSEAEAAAEKIDATDHRGVVGRVYLDLPGDIGVIAAGGGASLVAMDAMVSYGLKPANYTEFSGNPPADKVKRLTEIVLAKKGLRGAMLVGGKANFTDQYETLSGFVEGLKNVKPKYPIVVRRDGPRMEEAKKMLEEAKNKYGFDLYVYDAGMPIVEAVGKLVELVGGKDE